MWRVSKAVSYRGQRLMSDRAVATMSRPPGLMSWQRRLFRGFFLRDRRQIIALHRKADRFVPAAAANIDLDLVGTQILQVDRVAHRRHLGSFGFRDWNGRKIRISQGLGSRLLVVYIKSDVVNAAQVGSLSWTELRSASLAIFQNSKINVTVAEPDTLFATVAGAAI